VDGLPERVGHSLIIVDLSYLINPDAHLGVRPMIPPRVIMARWPARCANIYVNVIDENSPVARLDPI